MSTPFPLHQMIQDVIAGAKTKLAADESTSPRVTKLLQYEKKEHGHIPTVEEEKEEKTASISFTDPNYVEKLASACDWLSQNVDAIEPAGPLALALSKVAEKGEKGSPGGAGKGPGALTVSKAIGGTQSYTKDHPATEDAAESEAGSPLSKAGLPGGKTQLDNNMHKAPGQSSGAVPHAEYPKKGPLVNLKAKTASASQAATDLILEKLAGEDTFKANISAKGSSNPLAGKGQLESFDSTQAPPKASGGPTEGSGNQGRKLISSNKSAIDYNKKDAKTPVKAQLKEVLDEPALSRKTDSTVHRNLRNADKGGVKIAQVRNHFAKIAAGGCTCDGKGECEFCHLKEAAGRGRKGQEKVATMGGMGAPTSMGGMGGGGAGMGMSAMAGAIDPASPEGIESERIQRLKLLLAQARAGGAGIPGAAGGAPMQQNPATAGGAPATGAAGIEQFPAGTV